MHGNDLVVSEVHMYSYLCEDCTRKLHISQSFSCPKIITYHIYILRSYLRAGIRSMKMVEKAISIRMKPM